MRVTILPDDKSVFVDNEGYGDIDLSFMGADIHAVQWYDSHGEIERKDPVTKRMTSNEEITSFDAFQPAIAVWQAKKDEVAAAIAAEKILVGDEPNVIA
jgi:hypothetical protein